jgi:hypothetical protein
VQLATPHCSAVATFAHTFVGTDWHTLSSAVPGTQIFCIVLQPSDGGHVIKFVELHAFRTGSQNLSVQISETPQVGVLVHTALPLTLLQVSLVHPLPSLQGLLVLHTYPPPEFTHCFGWQGFVVTHWDTISHAPVEALHPLTIQFSASPG